MSDVSRGVTSGSNKRAQMLNVNDAFPARAHTVVTVRDEKG